MTLKAQPLDGTMDDADFALLTGTGPDASKIEAVVNQILSAFLAGKPTVPPIDNEARMVAFMSESLAASAMSAVSQNRPYRAFSMMVMGA